MTNQINKRGVNAQRRMFSGKTNYDEEIRALQTEAISRFFYRAVVVDVVFDLDAVQEQIKENLLDNLIHPELLETAPRNSIVARVITDGAARRNKITTVFYPAMSHTHEPVKPGEQVWVFFENPMTHDFGFWLSRIVEPIDIDDPNFTHADRKFINERQQTTMERLEESKQLEGLPADVQARIKAASGKGPQFPNGGDTEESFQLDGIDAYEEIEQTAAANKIITKEPVPRYNKRPGDWAAEGSNNTLIVMGEDRIGPAAEVVGGKVTAKPSTDKPAAAGAIDIVVGRGVDGTPSAPNKIENARKKIETDKSIIKKNIKEGDPDFENDLSRVYITMDTDVDKNFGKQLPNLNGGVAPAVISSGAATVIKSNHVRILARKDGTVRIVKEGDIDNEAGTGQAVILIEKDGTIMIDGPKIILGSAIEKDFGEGSQVFVGRDAVEPIVLGETLRSLLNEYTTSVKDLIVTFSDSMVNGVTPFAAPPGNLGNMGSPVPGVTGISTVITQASTTFKASIETTTKTFQDKIKTILSKVGKTK